MTLRRSAHLVRNFRSSDRVLVEADNLLAMPRGEHLSVASLRTGNVHVALYANAAGTSVDLDPDLARTIGTALLAAARVAERSGR